MKRFTVISTLFLLLSALFGGALSAQELKVVSFEVRPTDLTAKVKPREDLNGDAAALIRVQVAAPNVQFSGNIIGEVETGFGEYLVYLAKGSRHLRIYHKEYLFTPLDYEIPETIQSNLVYSLKLEVPIYTHYDQIAEIQAQKNKQIENVKTGYRIGDYYEKDGTCGVVFYVDNTGEHGKIVSLEESFEVTEFDKFSADYGVDSLFNALHAGLISYDMLVNTIKQGEGALRWTNSAPEEHRNIGLVYREDGAMNMRIVRMIAQWRSKFPAFAWCSSLGVDWYLPAIDELMLIYESRDKINATLEKQGKPTLNLTYRSNVKMKRKGEGKIHLSNYYCSSTESDESQIWAIDMKSGNPIQMPKKDYVFSVRAVFAF